MLTIGLSMPLAPFGMIYRNAVGSKVQGLHRQRKRPTLPSPVSLLALAALIGCIIGQPGTSLANDSEAELSIGGLVLRKNAHVEMRSENLYVSTKEIRVQYRFYNKSGSDVRVVVAFPLPQVNLDDDDDDERKGLTEHEFSTNVNGAPVTTQIERRALVGGMDRTDVLKPFRIPLDPNASQDALAKLPSDAWEKLTRAGVVKTIQYKGTPTEKHLRPLWTLKTAYYWEQTFPAKKEITIEHRYVPIVGGSVPMDWSRDWSVSEYQKKFCLDREFVRSAKQHKNSSQQWISYILTTGGNWAGPIGEFRLVVDKGHPASSRPGLPAGSRNRRDASGWRGCSLSAMGTLLFERLLNIGLVFPHKDNGGFNIMLLQAFPLDG